MRYELFADLDDAPVPEMGGNSKSGSVKRTTGAQAFPGIGSTMLFLFDYGDHCEFRVEVIGLGEKVPKTRYPKVLAVVGKAPPQYPDVDDEDE